MAGEIIYFAYGSNLDYEQMRARLGDAEIVGVGYLPGYSLAFNKRGWDGTAKANLVASSKIHKAWGVFYKITQRQIETMSRYEGGYSKVWVRGHLAEVLPEDFVTGEEIEAQTFISGSFTTAFPSAIYKERIITGMIEFGLPLGLIENVELVRTQRTNGRYKSNRSQKWA